ncbi:MAG: SMP-30/gluconolactonase/LRE family protein [Sphingomonas sp.]|nr:SMP-30/gluconolactonase/LRE family protein [Sphingomonas sp.]
MDKESPAECVADVKAILGEGPVWVEREQALYWLDIKGRKIFGLGESGELAQWDTPMRVGSIAPRQNGGFIAGTEDGFAWIDLDQDRFEIFHNPEPHLPDNRFNDGKTDPAGRFWAGTMDNREKQATGSLYRLDPNLECEVVDKGYKVTNGPAFSPDGRRMYHNDSARQTIYAFDFGPGGDPEERRVFAQFGEGDGYPDGMTVDSDGCLWVAFWDGWCLRRISADGEVIRKLEMPVQRPTSCAFGGSALDRLYVTSARVGLDANELDMQPCAGGLFLVGTGARGVPQVPFAG